MSLPSRLLIANRGEIACRIIGSCKKLGIEAIAVYSEADANSKHVRMADRAVLIGASAVTESYLNADKVLGAAIRTEAEAVHPGYGFLSENADFARRVAQSGLIWVGPSPECIESMGNKIRARELMVAAGVPVVPGTAGPVRDYETAVIAADAIGFPVMVKAAAGGGGIDMTIVRSPDELWEAIGSAQMRAQRFFSNDEVFIEKFIERARHVEVQVIGLRSGDVIALGERDCSVQRRHQKVLEETPAPRISQGQRTELFSIAVKAAQTVGYRGVGTVEFVMDVDSGQFYYLEMNTRLQVEHPITEMVTGLDLVHEQLLIASGEKSAVDATVPVIPSGHSIEFRVYAEDPIRFLPGPGTITEWVEPGGGGVRVDSGYDVGDEVTPFYDPLMAKVVVWGRDRAEAMSQLHTAVQAFRIAGPKNNLPLLAEILDTDEFYTGDYDTSLLSRMRVPMANNKPK